MCTWDTVRECEREGERMCVKARVVIGVPKNASRQCSPVHKAVAVGGAPVREEEGHLMLQEGKGRVMCYDVRESEGGRWMSHPCSAIYAHVRRGRMTALG